MGALNDYIRSQGGWLVSHLGEKHFVEVPRKSALPSKLIEFGYSVRSAGITTQITGGTENHGFTPVDIIEITL
jgi:hypothetical protein